MRRVIHVSSLFSYPCYSMATPGLYIDTNTLQVGIGTTRPKETFHVQGNLLSTGNITSQGTVTASNLSILGDFVTLNTITSNTEQMVIQNAGTGPALKVTQTGANSIAEFYDDGNALALKIADGGNVGIGTTNPQVKLHVASDNFNVISIQRVNNASGGAQIEMKNGSGYNVSTFIGGDSNMYFQSGAPGDNSKSFILAPSGNVGIGTLTPQAKLDINGNVLCKNLNIGYGSTTCKTNLARTSDLAGANSQLVVTTSSVPPPEDVQDIVKSLLYVFGAEGITNEITIATIPNNTTVTLSAYARTASGSANCELFLFNSGGGSGSSSFNIGVTWQRIVRTTTFTTGGSVYYRIDNNQGSELYITGLKAELSAIATPFTPYGTPLLQDTFTIQSPVLISQQLNIVSNNANSILVTTPSGNVGIGTTNPLHKLEVNGLVKGNVFVGDALSTNISGDGNAMTMFSQDYSGWASIFSRSWLGNITGWGMFWCGNAGAQYRLVDGDTNPNELTFVGSGQKRFTFDLDAGGNAYFDGALTQNAYDYAEMFEWSDGNVLNEDRRGYSVVLESGKIRKAELGDDVTSIIGIVSGTSCIIGDAAAMDWSEKYLIDEWGTRVCVDTETWSWKNSDGSFSSYNKDEIPENIDVPQTKQIKLHKKYVLNHTYDPNKSYIPREDRKEWSPIGLLGKVRLRKDEPIHPNWKLIKSISPQVDLYLIK